MRTKKNKAWRTLIHADIFLALFLWCILFLLKAFGVIGMHWALVLSGIVWLSWGLFALTAFALLLCRAVPVLKERRRRREIDRRIKRQVQALGLWDAPRILGGRALELKAAEYGIIRAAGETDASLRRRLENVMEWVRHPHIY